MSDVNTCEEISLFDIWRILVKHKITFWVVFFIIFLLGILFVFYAQKNYDFTQVVTVANYTDESGRGMPVKSIDYISKKITATFLPKAVANYNTAHKAQIDARSINIVTAPLADTSISLSTKGMLAKQPFYAEVFANIISQLKAETNPIISYRKKELEAYSQTLEDIANKEAASDKETAAALSSNATESTAKFFMISAIQKQNNLLAQVAEKIKDAKLKESSLYQTEASTDLTVAAAGPSRSVLIILSAVIGLIFGFFAVFIKEFLVKFKQQSVEK
jgi:uncharacterized integral membrane protein